ncbi:hypothetical protein [Acidovorax cavernicola]|uniref:hypothetical protein n=1 Tax=Acidovorax cavernicola TaxID=1675792 RepID=UPI00142E2E07|nr:hypothetical protein [Acidovorax cavernicola]
MKSLVGGSVVGGAEPHGSVERDRLYGQIAPESGGARHAALLLHAMTPEDRAWVLRALSAAEREEMLRLLAELEALGIARDASLVAEATARADVGGPVVPSDEAMLMALDDSGIQRAVDCLRVEPVGLVAQWLRVAPWPWRDALVRALEPVQRRRLEELLSTPPTAREAVPPAMRAALIDAVARCVRAAPEASTPRHGSWKRIRHSIGRLWGRRVAIGSTPR